MLAGCVFLAGCGKTGSSNKAAAAGKYRLDWKMKTLVGDYNRIGNFDPAWDGPATNALAEFARVRCHITDPGESWAEIIATNSAAAVQAGCDDPMVRYLYLRFGMSQTESAKDFADAFCQVAKDMQKSGYSAVRKFSASERAVDQLFYVYGTNVQTVPEANQISSFVGQVVMSVVQDKTTPPEEVYEVCDLGLSGLGAHPGDYEKGYSMLEPPLFANWPNESTSWLLKGEAYTGMAWDARGSGSGDTVTAQGQETFAKDLAIAADALGHAWKLNPHDARIARQMMSVELGQGKGRDRMELWFQRAMALDPDYYDACSQKLYYLEPKWYGSTDDMLEFGRECVQNTNWGGTVPLILLDAHYTICNQYVDESERADYWKQPVVWADVKSAYERYFQLYPDDATRLPYYARYAYWAEDWDKLNELLPKLGPVNYDFFGGKEEFDKMVQLAGEHAAKPAAAP